MTIDLSEFAGLLHKRAEASIFAAVSDHGTIVGTAREIALANYLRGFVPRKYEILSGAIATTKDGSLEKATGQLDVMVVDTLDFPTVTRSGDLAVVLAPSVQVVVESKSDLADKAKFREAMQQIGLAKVIAGAACFTALYCFGAPAKPDTLKTHLKDILKERRSLLRKARAWTVATAPKKPGTKTARYSKEELLEKAANYSAGSLPDLIVTDAGAIAKLVRSTSGVKTEYFFYQSGSEPTVVALAEEALKHLSRVWPPLSDQEKAMQLLKSHFGRTVKLLTTTSPLKVTDTQPRKRRT